MWTSPVLFSPPLCSQPGNKLNFSFWLSIPCPSPLQVNVGMCSAAREKFFQNPTVSTLSDGGRGGRTCVAKETEVKFVARWIGFQFSGGAPGRCDQQGGKVRSGACHVQVLVSFFEPKLGGQA